MTGPVINLRRERKRRARAAESAQGRPAAGVGKGPRALAEAERHLIERRLAGHRREDDSSQGDA